MACQYCNGPVEHDDMWQFECVFAHALDADTAPTPKEN